jgi:hypothetical protein
MPRQGTRYPWGAENGFCNGKTLDFTGTEIAPGRDRAGCGLPEHVPPDPSGWVVERHGKSYESEGCAHGKQQENQQ